MAENKDKKYNSDKQWELVNFCEFDKYAAKSYCAIHNVDESKNLGDITKVNENELDDFNMICGGSPCFVEGTLVLTELGYKPIEEIEIGDIVYTKEKRWKKVKRIGSDGEKEICSISGMGILPIECTLNHPFWIKHKCRKWNNDIRRYDYYLSDAEKVYAENLTTDDFIGIPIIKDSDNELYKISDELLWLLGRYVADGSISDTEVILSIGMNKISEFDNISINHRTYKHTKSCYRVVFNKTSELYHFISKYNFGKGAINKNVPIEILELTKDKLKIFLDGYWSGDGCSIKDTTIRQATTISRKLALMLVLAIQKVYSTGCKVYFDKRPDKYEIEGRIVNQSDTYMVRFLTENSKKQFFVEDDFVWYPIKDIKKDGFKKVIYNIEVEDDHTYIANGATVFNCQDFSVAGKQKGSVWTCKECGEEYNPLTVHWSKRDECPNCGSHNIEKTRSSLLVEYLRVVRANKPNFGIYENVKNIVGKQFKDTTFKLFTDELEEYGYNVYWKVLNAKNYGIPQNRERVYLLFIKKDLDNGKFEFPEPFDNGLRLKDLLEDEVDKKFYISDEKTKKFIKNLNTNDLDNVHMDSPKFIGNVNREDFGTGYAGGVWDDNHVSPTLTTMQGGGRQPHVITGLVKNKGEEFTKETEYANTLLARDYKGFGNQEMNCVVENNKVAIKQATKQGYIECEVGGVADLSYPDSKTRRGRVQDCGNTCPTITATETGICRIENSLGNTTNKLTHAEWKQKMYEKFIEDANGEVSGVITNQSQSFGYRSPMKGFSKTLRANANDTGIVDGVRIRKLTPKECFRLMGFSDKDFFRAMIGQSDLAEEFISNHKYLLGKTIMDEVATIQGISNSQLYKQAGNSIVVDVLYYIYVELYKAMPYLFDDLKLSSFFSGIGAFEIGLDRLYKGINSGNFMNPQTE